MRYGITLLGGKIAPRSIFFDSMLVASMIRSRVRTDAKADLHGHGLLELAKTLSDNRIDVLVCGGISRDERDFLEARRIEVIDNIVGPIDEILTAIQEGKLRPGYGLNDGGSGVDERRSKQTDGPAKSGARNRADANSIPVDCLSCRNRVCLDGERCEVSGRTNTGNKSNNLSSQMLEATLDISFENERTLCRLSELIYFCQEMHYENVGLAYCIDLEEPAEILVRVLRRFFKVYPVCCKIGGKVITDSITPHTNIRKNDGRQQIACNPFGQIGALNRVGTDINVLVGLCMGADCSVTQHSDAPVTTLFVKDRSLANNPIGAVYSDYYLNEAIRAARNDIEKDLSS